MNVLGQATCLVLLCITVASVHGAVSEEEKNKILKGLEAGKEFTEVLGNAKGFKGFTDSLKKMNDIIGPWVDGIGIFSSVLGMFLPEDNAMLEAMKQGFKEVNQRLDDIKEGLEEVKKAIDWAVVKINFQAIEQDIRLMDEKLKEVFQAPTPDDGRDEYIRVYEDQYDEAGLLLWDAIVKDDQIFYENIVRAGMEYTNYRRDKMNEFMKGLIALIMKSANIEVSYEKFKEQDRGMEKIWKDRLTQTQQALLKADGVLQNAWEDLFRGEVDQFAKDLEGQPLETFRDAVYKFLTDKYPWRYWGVLVYDPVIGGDKHGVWYLTSYCYSRFRIYGRNWLVTSADPDWSFDEAAAKATVVRDITCPHDVNTCSRESSYTIVDKCQKEGIAVAALWENKSSWSVIGIRGRIVWGKMYLRKDWWYRLHWQFQFG